MLAAWNFFQTYTNKVFTLVFKPHEIIIIIRQFIRRRNMSVKSLQGRRECVCVLCCVCVCELLKYIKINTCVLYLSGAL